MKSIINRNAGLLALWAMMAVFVFSSCSGADQEGAVEEALAILGPRTPAMGGDTLFHEIGDFSFLAHTGGEVTQETFKDKITVVDVFFTRCTGICPALSKSIAEVQEAFKDDPEVMFLSITVDPENDSLQALQAYADKYGAIPGKWYLVTGDKAELYEFANKRFFFKAMEGEGGELGFIHDKEMRLLDHQGRMRGTFHYDGTDESSVTQLIEDIKLLKNEYAKSE